MSDLIELHFRNDDDRRLSMTVTRKQYDRIKRLAESKALPIGAVANVIHGRLSSALDTFLKGNGV